MTDATLIVLSTSVGTAVTLLVGLYKESRNRKWDAQDREEKADALRLEAKQAASLLASQVEATVKQESAKTRADVAKNTLVSDAAKTAAEEAVGTIAAVKADVEDLKTNGFAKKDQQ